MCIFTSLWGLELMECFVLILKITCESQTFGRKNFSDQVYAHFKVPTTQTSSYMGQNGRFTTITDILKTVEKTAFLKM